ncbi:hypothetical protein E0L93_02495 [Rubrobacter taiwanensis]|jgi:hypothetical protein|uniref:Uncharacterized protein n=1 Tax=Rubrobacter taiwanensis TaxID=185139 RepID=A0A4R1BRK9_9ACTN|nr:hypothetical protein [Rubrobacter taiwanensis]TCJ19845.1 hypothetical protein E0L93_02495 [Rubrobacter taiwanensis]
MEAKNSALLTEAETRWEKLLCPQNCSFRMQTIEPETWSGLWKFDLKGIPAFISAYKNVLEMVRWLAIYEPEKAIPLGEDALADLEELLRVAREKLSYEMSRDDVPDSYEWATSECIQRLEAIHAALAALIDKVETGTEKIEKAEVYSLLERLHQHTVNPPGWTDYKPA